MSVPIREPIEIYADGCHAASKLSLEYIGVVGVPPDTTKQCGGSHHNEQTCKVCGWNLCQTENCKSSNTVCAFCQHDRFFRYLCLNCNKTRFSGWTGWCITCYNHRIGRLPKVPDHWTEMIQEIYKFSPAVAAAAAPAAAAAATTSLLPAAAAAPWPSTLAPPAAAQAADVIVLDSDDDAPQQPKPEDPPAAPAEPDEIKRIKQEVYAKYPSHWDPPLDGNPWNPWFLTVYPIDPKLDGAAKQRALKYVWSVFEDLREAQERCMLDENQRSVPRDYFHCCGSRKYTYVEQIVRFHNLGQRMVFDAASLAVQKQTGMTLEEVEQRVFHGTCEDWAMKIFEKGFKATYTTMHVYGQGIYCSRMHNLAAEHYNIQQRRGRVPALVGCTAAVGRCTRTKEEDKHPPPGFNTGGTGNGWIYTIFDDAAIIAEYMVLERNCTKEEWESQRAELQSEMPGAGGGGCKASFNYTPTSPRYSPTSPKYTPAAPSLFAAPRPPTPPKKHPAPPRQPTPPAPAQPPKQPTPPPPPAPQQPKQPTPPPAPAQPPKPPPAKPQATKKQRKKKAPKPAPLVVPAPPVVPDPAACAKRYKDTPPTSPETSGPDSDGSDYVPGGGKKKGRGKKGRH